MTRSGAAAILLETIGWIRASPRRVLWLVTGLGAFVLAVFFPAEFLIISAGLLGVVAGYGQQKAARSENPIRALRGRWGLSRLQIVTLSSAVSLGLALLLFLAGIGALTEASGRNIFWLAAASAFYAFALCSYFFGRNQISKARRQLALADARQVHEWRLSAKADTPVSGASQWLRRLTRISEPSR